MFISFDGMNSTRRARSASGHVIAINRFALSALPPVLAICKTAREIRLNSARGEVVSSMKDREPFRERHDVVEPFAQGRDLDLEYVGLLLVGLRQVRVCGG